MTWSEVCCDTARYSTTVPDPADCLQKPPPPPVYTKQDYYKLPPQFDKVWQALKQPGARVLLHGAPGLGKTAMANVLAKRFGEV
jgi:NADPH:quinone reductase-like Zn-dependent oxidoreductase